MMLRAIRVALAAILISTSALADDLRSPNRPLNLDKISEQVLKDLVTFFGWSIYATRVLDERRDVDPRYAFLIDNVWIWRCGSFTLDQSLGWINDWRIGNGYSDLQPVYGISGCNDIEEIRLQTLLATRNKLSRFCAGQGYVDDPFPEDGAIGQNYATFVEGAITTVEQIQRRLEYFKRLLETDLETGRGLAGYISFLQEINDVYLGILRIGLIQLGNARNVMMDNLRGGNSPENVALQELTTAEYYGFSGNERVGLVTGGLYPLNQDATCPVRQPDVIDFNLNSVRDLPPELIK